MQDPLRAPVRVLVVDDDDVFRTSLQTLLNSDPRVEVVGVAHNLESAVATAAVVDPQVALVDVLVGRELGFAICEALHAQQQDLVVLMMSGLDPSDYEREARAAGADGFIVKSSFVGGAITVIVQAVTRLS